MAKHSGRKDMNQTAKLITDISTGQASAKDVTENKKKAQKAINKKKGK